MEMRAAWRVQEERSRAQAGGVALRLQECQPLANRAAHVLQAHVSRTLGL